MDCAKGINFLYSCGGRMQDYWGEGKATGPLLPMIAVPTTAGTGSETQSYALVADAETHVKMACGDKRAAFRVAILDPELTLTQPRVSRPSRASMHSPMRSKAMSLSGATRYRWRSVAKRGAHLSGEYGRVLADPPIWRPAARCSSALSCRPRDRELHAGRRPRAGQPADGAMESPTARRSR